MIQGAKLDVFHENPVDQGFIGAADATAPLFKQLGMTPNMVTSLSAIASVLAARAVLKSEKGKFALWALLSYFFDCLDGHMARKYDMCSKFGDYYDHITDWMYYGLLFYSAFFVRGLKRDAKPYAWIIYGGLATAGLGMMWHFGCQESLYARRRETEVPLDSPCHFEAHTLKPFCAMCKNPDKWVHFSRFFGCGTFTLFVIAVIILFVR